MNLSTKQVFITGLIINLITGNAFFTYFGILNMQTWHQWDSSFLILDGIFSCLCVITFYIAFYKSCYYLRSAMSLFLISLLCCFVITFLGGFFIGVFTSFQVRSMDLFSVTDIGILLMVNLIFGIWACFLFGSIVLIVGILNGFWFLLMKKAKQRELVAGVSSQ
ncbi:hypothetical protein [Orbus mooreae]|uniref:hypothetical protein n=1 Tax=Orbus mooreae TaxID=3074107 RepID=UPI00370D8A6C